MKALDGHEYSFAVTPFKIKYLFFKNYLFEIIEIKIKINLQLFFGFVQKMLNHILYLKNERVKIRHKS